MNRKQAKAVNIEEAFGSSIKIPYLVEVKEFMRQHPDQAYGIPSFIDGDSMIMVMRFKTKKDANNLMTLINPTYLSVSGLIMSEEVQYGVDGTYLVPRHPKIEVMYVKTPKGISMKQTLVGKSALMFQQAYEALNGKYIDDFGLRIDTDEDYQKLTDDEKSEYARAYLDELKDYLAELEKDEEVKKYEAAVDFTSEKIAVGVEADKMIEEARKNESANVQV